MIHVCYGLRDESGKYSKFVGTSMVSIFENTREEVTIHILHDKTLTTENRNRLIFTALEYDQKIEFYDVEELVPNCHESIRQFVPRVQKHWAGLAGFYRMLIPDLLPQKINRAIYLDVDTIVNLDIAELWQIDLEGYPLAAIAEVESNIPRERTMQICVPCQLNLVAPEDYFNSGLLFFDLVKIRKIFGGGGQQFIRELPDDSSTISQSRIFESRSA